MKRKRLALLLALAMTVTSLDGTALVASGADFSSEPAVSEASRFFCTGSAGGRDTGKLG